MYVSDLKKKKKTNSKHAYPNVHRTIIYNSQNMAPQVQMYKEYIYIYIYIHTHTHTHMHTHIYTVA